MNDRQAALLAASQIVSAQVIADHDIDWIDRVKALSDVFYAQLAEAQCYDPVSGRYLPTEAGRCGILAPVVWGAEYRPPCALTAGHRGWHSDRQNPPCEWSNP